MVRRRRPRPPLLLALAAASMVLASAPSSSSSPRWSLLLLPEAVAFSSTHHHRHRRRAEAAVVGDTSIVGELRHRHRRPIDVSGRRFTTTGSNSSSSLSMMASPPSDDDGPSSGSPSTDEGNNSRDRIKSELASLLRSLVDPAIPDEEAPSLLARNIEIIMGALADIDGKSLFEEVVLEEVEAARMADGDDIDGIGDADGDGRLDRLSEAVGTVVSFAESFAEEAASMDDKYKTLLRKIFTTMAPDGLAAIEGASSSSSTAMEEELDDLLASEKEAFTPGFLRHVEGECDRLASLPEITPETVRMLQILRVVQARLLEELGKDMGEGAVVLGQLLGYDDESERLAVLDAGLAVRGADFAVELAKLTEEALEGFGAIPGGADPELVERVEAIDARIRSFVERNNAKEMDFQ